MNFSEWYDEHCADTGCVPDWCDVINGALELGLIPSASNNRAKAKIKCDICGSLTKLDPFTGASLCPNANQHPYKVPPAVAPNQECS